MTGNIHLAASARNPPSQFSPQRVSSDLSWTGGSPEAHHFDRRLLNDLFRTGCTTVYPNFYLRHRIWSGEGRQCAAFPWTPTPADKIVVRNVMEKICEGSSAILLRIFDLLAKLPC
jgi:hypothetical protein